MIRVYLLENRQGICGFLCEGHAGYAEDDQDDVVCAAITAIAGTTVTGLTDIVEIEVDWDFRSGHLKCQIIEATGDQTEAAGDQTEVAGDQTEAAGDQTEVAGEKQKQADLLLRTFFRGCQQIEYSYGSQYVTCEEQSLQVNSLEEKLQD